MKKKTFFTCQEGVLTASRMTVSQAHGSSSLWYNSSREAISQDPWLRTKDFPKFCFVQRVSPKSSDALLQKSIEEFFENVAQRITCHTSQEKEEF